MKALFERITTEKGLLYVIIGGFLIVLIIIVYLFIAYGTKSVKITAPIGKETWEIGQTYEITWNSRELDKIGIVLFNGSEPEWIGENINAKSGKYQWQIYKGHQYGDNFRIAVFEYPWQEGNKIDYSDEPFAISYSFLDSCEALSVAEEWPYLSSDFPEIRKVFITEQSFSGNLDGLIGADKICQQAAEEQGWEGEWIAFLGGDRDQETAKERLKASSRGLEGIFVRAESSLDLLRGATCHQLLGRTFDDFLAKFSDLAVVNQEKMGQLGKGFLEDLANVWLGRIDEKSKRTCLAIGYEYSYAVTCQDWTQGIKTVQVDPPYPICYTPAGYAVYAPLLGGLASDLSGKGLTASFTPVQGKSCNTKQKLLCIEE